MTVGKDAGADPFSDAFADMMVAQTVVAAQITGGAQDFYKTSGRWPVSIDELKGTPMWQKRHPALSGYDSILFKNEGDGSLTVSLKKGASASSLKVQRPAK